jgi:hypothetical protein
VSNANIIGVTKTCTADSVFNGLVTTATNSGIYTTREIYNNNKAGIYPKAQYGVNGSNIITAAYTGGNTYWDGSQYSPIIYVSIDLIHSRVYVSGTPGFAINTNQTVGPVVINTDANRFDIVSTDDSYMSYNNDWFILKESTRLTGSRTGQIFSPNTDVSFYLNSPANPGALYLTGFTLFFYSV